MPPSHSRRAISSTCIWKVWKYGWFQVMLEYISLMYDIKPHFSQFPTQRRLDRNCVFQCKMVGIQIFAQRSKFGKKLSHTRDWRHYFWITYPKGSPCHIRHTNEGITIIDYLLFKHFWLLTFGVSEVLNNYKTNERTQGKIKTKKKMWVPFFHHGFSCTAHVTVDLGMSVRSG